VEFQVIVIDLGRELRVARSSTDRNTCKTTSTAFIADPSCTPVPGQLMDRRGMLMRSGARAFPEVRCLPGLRERHTNRATSPDRQVNRAGRTVPGVDDAGGGRRGLRAVVSAELWEVLAGRWAIPRQPGRDLGGSLNLNLLVSRGAERLVARVHRRSVSPARLEAIQAVRGRLDAAGVPCSALVPARDGARWARAGDRLAGVDRFIGHDGAMDSAGRLARGLPLLGRMHALLAGIDVCAAGRAVEFANHIEPGAALASARAGAARIRGWQPTPEERRMAGRTERLAGLVTAGEAGLAAGTAAAADPR
jgi:hypothetical protein